MQHRLKHPNSHASRPEKGPEDVDDHGQDQSEGHEEIGPILAVQYGQGDDPTKGDDDARLERNWGPRLYPRLQMQKKISTCPKMAFLRTEIFSATKTCTRVVTVLGMLEAIPR